MSIKETRNKIRELNLLPGDRVFWQGANRRITGIVEKSGEANVIRTADGCTFGIADVISSISFKKEEQ